MLRLVPGRMGILCRDRDCDLEQRSGHLLKCDAEGLIVGNGHGVALAVGPGNLDGQVLGPRYMIVAKLTPWCTQCVPFNIHIGSEELFLFRRGCIHFSPWEKCGQLCPKVLKVCLLGLFDGEPLGLGLTQATESHLKSEFTNNNLMKAFHNFSIRIGEEGTLNFISNWLNMTNGLQWRSPTIALP